MDDTTLIIASILGLTFYLALIYFVIRGANETTQRDKIQLQNQKILALIAEKNGVEVEKLNKILKS